jgi:hypothetical protein
LHAEGGGGELGVQVGDELGDPGLPAQRRRGARGPEDPGEVGLVRPEYFEALNEDFSYQLTVIGKFAQAIIAEEIQDNRFAVRTDIPGVKVSWQVTGVRRDPYAQMRPIHVEEDKPEHERGTYLFPAGYDQPENRGVDHAREKELGNRQVEFPREPTVSGGSAERS